MAYGCVGLASERMGPSATSHREVECKWRISASDHAATRAFFRSLAGQEEGLAQSNRFYDSEAGSLRREKMSLRLRLENTRLLLTCKRRVAARQGALHQQHEEECWLNSCLWTLLNDAPVIAHGTLPLPPQARAALGQQPLINMGGFENQRYQWRLGGDVLCLDCTDFPGGHRDYEIEIELGAERDQDWWQNTLRQAGIAIRPQPDTKLHRYLRLR